MRVSVTFRHMEQTDELRKYAEGKIGKLKKYLYNPVDASVILSVEKHRQIAEIIINADKTTFKGKEATDNMHSAIDMVMDKIEKQIRRYKGKQVSHKGNSVRNPINVDSDRAGWTDDESRDEDGGSIITRTIDTKPMTVEEASMQLDVSKNDFLVFFNADTKDINVIYRRRDNNYGHIIPNIDKD